MSMWPAIAITFAFAACIGLINGWLIAYAEVPSLFWIDHSDAALRAVAWSGFALSCVVAAGYANALLMAALWVLYSSIVHVGQEWYGYGWEIQLIETGFLAIFLCPLFDGRPFPRRGRRRRRGPPAGWPARPG